MNRVLWVLQVLIGLLFVWAGGAKLVMTLEQMAGPVSLPGPFLRFIGVCELLGGLGLILPGLFRIKTGLTPLAAAGLAIIMAGATVITLVGGMGAAALMPFIVGLLALFIAYARWRLSPLRT